jgi:cytochrome c-type biogenesis protein CcmH/NrfG
MNANDIELALRARAAFNDSVECIDAETRRRLRNLRLRAQQGEPRHAPVRWAWPAGAALTAILALAVFLPRMPHTPIATMPATTVAASKQPTVATSTHRIAAAAVATSVAQDPAEAVDPDMLTDLDFYGWLAKQPGANASGG